MKYFLPVILIFLCQVVAARTIEVGKSKAVTSLKKAVPLAQSGDTILLNKGIYKEGKIVIDKPLRLIGIDEPVLDGESKNELLVITGREVIVKGIRFTNTSYSNMNDDAAINIIDASYLIIENNTIEHAYFAIHVANSSNIIIRNNTIKGTPKTEQTTGNGIHLWKCSQMLVEDNHVQGHRDGIYFEFVTHSYIQNNFSTKNIRYGLHFMFSNDDAYLGNTFLDNGAGVSVMFSKFVLMQNNQFEKNWGASAYGLLLKEISDSRIIGNRFVQNTMGIMMEGTSRIEVFKNAFVNNGWALKVQASCNDNEFLMNNFMGNTFDVATNGTMMLNKFHHNYWDKYDGYDLNRNRIGDVPYHPVSMYSMVMEQNPNSVILLRSFMVTLLDKAEKAIPSLTPENLVDNQPLMKPVVL